MSVIATAGGKGYTCWRICLEGTINIRKFQQKEFCMKAGLGKAFADGIKNIIPGSDVGPGIFLLK